MYHTDIVSITHCSSSIIKESYDNVFFSNCAPGPFLYLVDDLYHTRPVVIRKSSAQLYHTGIVLPRLVHLLPAELVLVVEENLLCHQPQKVESLHRLFAPGE